VGLLFTALGFVLWGLYHVAQTREQHSFTSGKAPPTTVQLHAGTKYRLGIPGGVAAALKVGIPPASLQCTVQYTGGAESRLTLATEQSDTKATDQIASFTASTTGPAHVACAALSDVYVDNVTGDPSGFLLVLATAALVVGVPLALSGLRGRTVAAEPAASARTEAAPAVD
jgi:hypothetical protein